MPPNDHRRHGVSSCIVLCSVGSALLRKKQFITMSSDESRFFINGGLVSSESVKTFPLSVGHPCCHNPGLTTLRFVAPGERNEGLIRLLLEPHHRRVSGRHPYCFGGCRQQGRRCRREGPGSVGQGLCSQKVCGCKEVCYPHGSQQKEASRGKMCAPKALFHEMQWYGQRKDSTRIANMCMSS